VAIARCQDYVTDGKQLSSAPVQKDGDDGCEFRPVALIPLEKESCAEKHAASHAMVSHKRGTVHEEKVAETQCRWGAPTRSSAQITATEVRVRVRVRVWGGCWSFNVVIPRQRRWSFVQKHWGLASAAFAFASSAGTTVNGTVVVGTRLRGASVFALGLNCGGLLARKFCVGFLFFSEFLCVRTRDTSTSTDVSASVVQNE
jgi:hypothetical protein